MHSPLDRDAEDPRLSALLRRMRELPAEERPPWDWPEFVERAAHSRPRRTWRWRPGWRHAGLAAAAACLIIVAAMWTRFSEPEVVVRAGVERPSESSDARWLRDDITAGWHEAMAHAREPAIVRVDTHLGVMDLEDSIAWVDELITMERTGDARPARVMALERERSRLVDSLVRVRYAETLAGQLPD